ncbi:phage major capsid protein [Opitutaceae bacterium TAV4]|nr:phage major capsid protein [Opitutaceae bacterium TAV4]RRK00788.1 phage major capsid protein [Opitutaceae bacterium TAV3]
MSATVATTKPHPAWPNQSLRPPHMPCPVTPSILSGRPLPAWALQPLCRGSSDTTPLPSQDLPHLTHGAWREQTLRRTLVLDTRDLKLNEEARTIEVSFSSETPILRWGDNEILSHAPDACDLSRLNDGGIVLFNHNRDDYIGVVVEKSARIDSDRKGRATLRFGTGERADKIFADVKAGILRQISVGYLVLEWQHTHATDGKSPDTYTALRWQPYEISIVTVAADPSVGVGRAYPNNNHNANNSTNTTMNRDQLIAALRLRGIAFDEGATDAQLKAQLDGAPPPSGTRAQPPPAPPSAPAAPPTPPATDGGARSLPPSTTITTGASVTEILDLADAYARAIPTAHDLARQAIRQQHNVQQFQRTLLDALNTSIQANARGLEETATIGLGKDDIKNFSFSRLLYALTAQPGERLISKDNAARELEIVHTASEKARSLGREVNGVIIPYEILSASRRDIISQVKSTEGYTGTGSSLVQDTVLFSSFIDLLRNVCVFLKITTPLRDLRGSITIPKKIAGATSGWLTEEDGDAPETDLNFGQISLAHKTVAAYTQLTRDMLKQPSMDVDAMVRKDLADAQGFAIDTAGFYGTGLNGQPRGLKNVDGISAVQFADGALTYPGIVGMESAIASQNADISRMLYAFNTTIRGKAKTTKRFAESSGESTIWEPGNTVNGYGAEVTNQILSTDIFFGVWSEMIHAMWGGLEILADQKVRNGRVEVSTFQDINFLCRRPECFVFGDLSTPPPAPPQG